MPSWGTSLRATSHAVYFTRTLPLTSTFGALDYISSVCVLFSSLFCSHRQTFLVSFPDCYSRMITYQPHYTSVINHYSFGHVLSLESTISTSLRSRPLFTQGVYSHATRDWIRHYWDRCYFSFTVCCTINTPTAGHGQYSLNILFTIRTDAE